MAEHTGGHYLDTGDGPKPISIRVVNTAPESAARQAYRAYLDHRPGCEQCRQSTFQCDAASELWEEFKRVRAAES